MLRLLPESLPFYSFRGIKRRVTWTGEQTFTCDFMTCVSPRYNLSWVPTIFICSCVGFCLNGPFNCISFCKVSRQLSAFSLCFPGLISALLVLSTVFLAMKVSLRIYSVLASISVFMALSAVFHSINSTDNSPFSHSVLPVLSLPYRSFQLYVSYESFLHPWLNP